MRKVLIAGNWKMYTDIEEAEALANELCKVFKNKNKVKVVICPPFTNLVAVNMVIKGSQIELGAQNMHYEDQGAFTGEISPLMLKNAGCKYVIIGHSERREYFKENNELLNKKVKTALKYQLIPIFCVGEKLEEREADSTFDVIKKQLIEGLAGITDKELEKVVVAYEPVWAIGTGKTATPEQAEEVHKFIREQLAKISDKKVAENISILYGGSVKPDNVTLIMDKPNIDGALVGGASLKADSFLKIVNY